MSNSTGRGPDKPTTKRHRTTAKDPAGRTRPGPKRVGRWHNFPEIPVEPRVALILLWVSVVGQLVFVLQILTSGLLEADSLVLQLVLLAVELLVMTRLHRRRPWARTLIVVLTIPAMAWQVLAMLSAPRTAEQPLVTLEQLPLFLAGTVAPVAAAVLLLRPQAKRWFVAAPATGRPDRRAGTV